MIKLSVNLSSEVVKALRTLAKKRGVTMTEVIRQAIGTEKFLDEVTENGGKILIESKNGSLRQIVMR